MDVPSVDGASLFEEMKAPFAKHDQPWETLLSMLLDSAGWMRGEKSGIEVCIRELAPHLLNIDGDSCRHMHNIVKNFTLYFGVFLERLLCNLCTDFKHSTDSFESLKELSFHFDLTFQKLSNYIAA